MTISRSPYVPDNLVSRNGFSRPVPRQAAHLHTQAESGAYLRDSSRVPRRRPCVKPPYAIGSVPSLSGHAIAHRWRSLPKVRRHRASKPQGSSERVLPWQVTMDQLICGTKPPISNPPRVRSSRQIPYSNGEHHGTCKLSPPDQRLAQYDILGQSLAV